MNQFGLIVRSFLLRTSFSFPNTISISMVFILTIHLANQKLPENTNLGISATRLSNPQGHTCVVIPPEHPLVERKQHILKGSAQADGLLTINNLTKQLQIRSDKAGRI